MTGIQDFLANAEVFFSDKKNFCQKTSARDTLGRPVSSTDPSAVQFCITGYTNKYCQYSQCLSNNIIYCLEQTPIASFHRRCAYIVNDAVGLEGIQQMIQETKVIANKFAEMPDPRNMNVEELMQLHVSIRGETGLPYSYLRGYIDLLISSLSTNLRWEKDVFNKNASQRLEWLKGFFTWN